MIEDEDIEMLIDEVSETEQTTASLFLKLDVFWKQWKWNEWWQGF